MAEAIFAKYSKSSGGNFTIPDSLKITNTTKFMLGLSNSATLDDCLQLIGGAGKDYATVQVTLKDVDGNILPGHTIKMQQVGGTTLNYTTDALGQCIFRTNAGSITLLDESNTGYIDITEAATQQVDCPVGTVKTLTMQRSKRFTNGDTVGNYNANTSIKFSKFTNTVDIEMQGASGRGGSAGCIWNCKVDGTDRLTGKNCYGRIFEGSMYVQGTGLSPSFPVTNIRNLSLGVYNNKGEGILSIPYNFYNNTVNYTTKSVNAMNYGGNGELGEFKLLNTFNVSNNTYQLIFPGFYVQNEYQSRFTSFYTNAQRYTNNHITTHIGFQGINGESGGSITGFGYTIIGGVGGEGGIYSNKQHGDSKGSGVMSGFPGTKLYAEYRSLISNNQTIYLHCYLQKGNSYPGHINIRNIQYK